MLVQGNDDENYMPWVWQALGIYENFKLLVVMLVL